MPTLAILFFLFIGFYIGLFAGIFLAYKLKQWKDEDFILYNDFDEWIKDEKF